MRVDRRWMMAGLGVSVILNLFLSSVLIGRFFAPAALGPGLGGLAPAARVRLLSEPERSAFVKAMAPHRQTIRQARLAQRAARAAVEADIRAEPLDRAKLAQDLTALRQAQDHQAVEVHAGLVDALGVLSPASRAALTARVRGFGPKAEAPQPTPQAVEPDPAHQ